MGNEKSTVSVTNHRYISSLFSLEKNYFVSRRCWDEKVIFTRPVKTIMARETHYSKIALK
jgi:hypothetical protein